MTGSLHCRERALLKSETPSANSTRGNTSACQAQYDYRKPGTRSQGYLRSPPIRDSPTRIPYRTRECHGPDGIRTRTFALDRLICCQLHHGPRPQPISHQSGFDVLPLTKCGTRPNTGTEKGTWCTILRRIPRPPLHELHQFACRFKNSSVFPLNSSTFS